MARNKLQLPIKATLTATRKGRGVTFRYVETPGKAGRAKRIANTKRMISMLDSDDRGIMRGLRVITTKTTIGIAGTVSTERFGEIMCNEFSCWATKARRDDVQREIIAVAVRKLLAAAPGSDPAVCLGHIIASDVHGVPSTRMVESSGVSVPLCETCAAVVTQHDAQSTP